MQLCEKSTETINHLLDECPVASGIWDSRSGLFKINAKHSSRPDLTIFEWPKNKFKKKILNRIWDLYPGFMVWEIWKTRNLKIFENRNRRVEELWATLDAHIKETITLSSWSSEDLEANAKEKLILEEWGINQLPQNNAHLC